MSSLDRYVEQFDTDRNRTALAYAMGSRALAVYPDDVVDGLTRLADVIGDWLDGLPAVERLGWMRRSGLIPAADVWMEQHDQNLGGGV